MKPAAVAGIPVYSGEQDARDVTPGNFYVDCFVKANIWQLSPHRRTYYQVIFFREGTGKQQVDFNTYVSNGPALVLLSPNQVHQMDISTDARGHIFVLPAHFFDLESSVRDANSFNLPDVFDNIELHPFLETGPEDAALLDNTIRQIQAALNAEGSMKKMILQAYVRIFLLQVYQIREKHIRSGKSTSGSGYARFRQFKSLVEKNYRSIHHPNDYAQMMHVSLKHLNMMCRKHGNASPGALIRKRIMLEAKRCLYHGNVQVKELAYLLGYDDPDYFNRYFRKETGVSPGAYRKSVAKEPPG